VFFSARRKDTANGDYPAIQKETVRDQPPGSAATLPYPSVLLRAFTTPPETYTSILLIKSPSCAYQSDGKLGNLIPVVVPSTINSSESGTKYSQTSPLIVRLVTTSQQINININERLRP
jgi:hypothetical protein